MFLVSLKISFRSIVRDRSTAVIAILSLAIGIASFISLGIYALYEIAYDKHHADFDRIYRIVQQEQSAEPFFISRRALTGVILAPLLARDYQELDEYLRIQPLDPTPHLLQSGDNAFYWDNVVLADDNLFNFFAHDIVAGDSFTALVEPRSIAINESIASAYFGRENPIGQILTNDLGTDFRVTLVFKNLPRNTHLDYSAVISRSTLDALDIGSMSERMVLLRALAPAANTYIKLPTGINPEIFRSAVDDLIERYMPRAADGTLVSRYNWYLESLSSIHLNSLTDGSNAKNTRYLVLTYAVVAAFVLLVSNLNYTNLSLSRYSKRTKEIGLRKLLGAGRKQIVGHLFLENSLVLAFAFLIGLSLVPIIQALTPVGSFLADSVSVFDLLSIPSAAVIALGILFAGLISTLYPAFFLTSIKSIDIIQGKFRTAKSSVWMKETVIFVQFAVSTGGVVCAILMLQQTQAIQQSPLGFETQNKVVVRIRGNDNVARIPLLENQLRSHPNIESTAITNRLPFSLNSIGTGSVESNEGERQSLAYHRIYGDSQYIETFGIEILRGRDLSAKGEIPSTNAVVVNEAFVDAMDWQQPIGKILYTPGAYGLSEVVGVARNFNYLGFDSEIEPIAINTLDQQQVVINQGAELPFFYRYLVVSISDNNIDETLEYIRQTYNEFDNANPFLYQFLEEIYNELKSQQNGQAILMSIFAIVSVVIASAGLVAVVAFKIAEKTKELGIRKVLGADIAQLVALQLKEVLLNVSLAAIVGCVLASIVFGAWQEQFSASHRVLVEPWVFLVASGLVIALAVSTTVYQAASASQANPIDSLRYE